MKLYWGRPPCAIGIHILLEEIGVPGDATRTEPFRTLDPKEKAPVLVRDDGSTLTGDGAIATWLDQAGLGRSRTEAEGLEMVRKEFAIIDRRSAGTPYVGGATVSRRRARR